MQQPLPVTQPERAAIGTLRKQVLTQRDCEAIAVRLNRPARRAARIDPAVALRE